MSAKNNANQFINYPKPREGPPVPYKNETQSIPVFRGVPLAIGASIIHSIGFVQSYIWRNAGFNVIHDVPQLDQYMPRFDPTVIPIDNDHTSPRQAFPAPKEKRKGDYGFYTSADYRARYLSGELTPTAVVETLLPLINRETQPPGKHSVAFLESRGEIVRSAAEESTQRYKKGMSLGPFDGVPVAVKDEVHVKGYKRTLASKLDFKGDCDETSWCVKKWEEAGAIVIGKTNMHELGLDTNNNNPNYGTPRNPHNPNYYCGGSSGGSGYAVASGLIPIALGADGGGSIRIPSSFCGIWGLKPSHNRVSGAPSPSIDTSVGVLGPMASSIDDLALSYRVMAAPAPAEEDSTSALFPDASSTTIPQSSISRPRNKVIGVDRDWIDRADPSVRAVFDKTLEYYRTQKSYEVIDISIPCLPEGQRAHVLTIMAEISSSLPHPDQIRNLTPPNKVLVSMGTYQIKARDLLAAQRLRAILMSHLADLYTKYPGLLIFTPTSPIPGWRIGGGADLSHGLSDGKLSVRNMEYVYLANFTGCPAISCPAGYDEGSHAPIGVMAMGEWGAEEDLIAFARDGEGVLDESENEKDDSADSKSATTGTEGLKAPSAEGSIWVDVVAEAIKKATSTSSSAE